MSISEKIFKILNILLLAVFVPVLLCSVIVGNHMDYWDPMKIVTRLPNQVLLLIALAGLSACMFLFWRCGRAELSARANRAVNGVLALLFLGLYFVNVRVAKEIAFHLPWDIMVVRGAAYEIANKRMLGYQYYFSVYSNNIPIAYILGRIYRKAMEMQNYPYIKDFLWIQVNCALISVAGLFSCLTVKRLTKKWMPVAAVFFLYLVLVGISPWKIAPYTDTYGLIFPIMCVYFYVCFRQAQHTWSRYLCVFFSIVAGMAGGFVKPNLYIVVIALLGTELLGLLKAPKERWRFVLAEFALAAVLAFGGRAYAGRIIDEIGLDFNKEIEAGWQHYFLMGLNEETTGGYNANDVAIFGEFQTSRRDRAHAELERAADRLRDRGFFGTLYFYLNKMVMTFNDGVFGWCSEVWIDEYYPVETASNTALTQRLRGIFWPSDAGYDVGGYRTLCQLVWIFSILCIPGIALYKGKEREEYGIFTICFLGIFFYQLLFEARARYLFVFLPVLLTISVCGAQEYTNRIVPALKKRRRQSKES